MKFSYIKDDSPCGCLSQCSENYTDYFARRVGDSATLKDRDFKSHFEKGKVPENAEDCKEVCGLMGISIDIWNEVSEQKLREKYSTTNAITPKAKKHLAIFKINKDGGVVAHTPEQEVYNEFHYDLYKPDGFVATNFLELTNLLPIV